ncbi:Multidrug resistance-associated protein 1-like protein 4 [Colletotrichum chlorophyti]|uniref:Multidrug resistance-associated protein 1-like protein 4 n=1 Tax=Colletotrichum chlorophyti TaxID=708187 RepID=A0A1Q8S262_9PEZI|nr:Multidrug resistance-associated protein 1-like protein 4 [Colletotrichum chlorophyti]
MCRVRSALVSIIHETTIKTANTSAADSMTLMSTDIERIRMGLLNLHEIWANALEVAVASWLLQRQLGIAFLAPIILVLVCVFSTITLGRIAGRWQRPWIESTQRRMGHTANAIANLKSLKMAGLAEAAEATIQAMRAKEIAAGNRFRMMQAAIVVIAYTPSYISPVLTFASASKTLDAPTIYTTLAFLMLVATPLAQLIQVVPTFAAAISCLERIQEFVSQEPRVEYRVFQEEADSQRGWVAEVTDGCFEWEDGKATLTGINLSIPSSRLTMLVGPVAGGKSTLCKALLGEVPFARGRVVMTCERVGYCDQSPFLVNASIRDNIVAGADWDPVMYLQVIAATLLDHDFEQLSQGDETKAGTGGITLSGGQKQRVALARALYLRTSFIIADDVLSGLDATTAEQVFQRVFGPDGLIKSRGASALLCTHNGEFLPLADHIILLSAEGSVAASGSYTEIASSGKIANIAHLRAQPSGYSDPSTTQPAITLPSTVARQTPSLTRQRGDIQIYSHYFKTMRPVFLLVFLTCGMTYGFFTNFPTVWLKFWTGDELHQHTGFYLSLYASFQVAALLALFGNIIITLCSLITQSGIALHNSALHVLIDASLSFLTRTDAGTILNYFSQDLNLIDTELPMAVLNMSLDTFSAIGSAAVIATTSPFIIISYPLFLGILYGVQKLYLRTSRQMRILDLDAKSPLYTYFLETVSGIVTLRATGCSDARQRQLLEVLDKSQQPAYAFAMIQRWLAFTMNIIVAGLAIVVVTLATQLRSTTSVGLTGASLVSLMAFGELTTNLIRMFTMMETSIGAVARLKDFYESTTREHHLRPHTPPPSWPQSGKIMVKNVSAAYSETPDILSVGGGEDPSPQKALALCNVSFDVQPGEKVAVVGRTGSGKSSVVLLLLRLISPSTTDTGDDTPLVSIDGVSLAGLEPKVLRRRIIAIPQNSVYLTDGTFKLNLDPYHEASDNECYSVLAAVGLAEFVSSRGGLYTVLDPGTLSQGQKRLFDIARAVLRRRLRDKNRWQDFGILNEACDPAVAIGQTEKLPIVTDRRPDRSVNGVLLLDEPNAGVDEETDRTIWGVTKQEFCGYTIIAVAHRLNAIMDFDRVMVMDSGGIVETGQPQLLARTSGSRFSQLLGNT